MGDAALQYESSPDGTGNLLLIKTGTVKIGDQNTSTLIESALAQGVPDCTFRLVGEENIGSEIGSDLKRSAVWSILASLVGILVYVGVRFEFGVALGGVLVGTYSSICIATPIMIAWYRGHRPAFAQSK